MEADVPRPSPSATPRLRLAIVVQRYGAEITGGAEIHARWIVQRLSAHHDLEVLTSCARDHTDWAMHFAPGTDHVDGVVVRRFAHPVRNDVGAARVPEAHRWRFKLRRLMAAAGLPALARPNGDPWHDGQTFLRRQGPHCPDLLAWLAASRERYDLVVFFTALFEPTARGLPAWGNRSILVPLLHDEKPMYLPWFRQVFAAAGAVLYNTETERRLAQRLYGPLPGLQLLAGVGIDTTPAPAALQPLLARWSIAGPYVLYVGRVDVSKGCPVLFQAFAGLRRRRPEVTLVLVGQCFMPIPQDAGIVSTGFIAAADRDALIAGAAVVAIPSRHESLSLILLEAFAAGVPVVVNGASDVLRAHVQDSGAGRTYRSRRGFTEALCAAIDLSPGARAEQAERARRYVASYYTWDRVLGSFARAIAHVSALPDRT